MRKLIVISDCVRECPHVVRTSTPGAGCATDYRCGKAEMVKGKCRLITGYIEWDSELPKFGDFPKWCPLQEAEDGMYL